MAKKPKPSPPLDQDPFTFETDPSNKNYGTAKFNSLNVPAKLSRFEFGNARSYRAASADLHAGLNVIIGESDCGKTNVLRNIRALVRNAGLDAIRTSGLPEKSVATVNITDTDAGTFCLQRSENMNTCWVEYPNALAPGRDNDPIEVSDSRNQEWTSIGNNMPDEFKKLLALSPIDLSGVEADVHFSDQREPLFVVDDPPSKIAKMVGAVSGLDVLYRAVAAGDREKRDTASVTKAAQGVYDRAKQAHADAAALADRMAPHFLAFSQAEMGLEIANRARQKLGDYRTNYTTGREKARRIFDASQALTRTTEAAAAALVRATIATDQEQAYLAASWASAQADLKHRNAAPTLEAAQAQLAAAEALEPAANALAAAKARRHAYVTTHDKASRAKEAHDHAKQALADAESAAQTTYASLGPTAIPCPTCGTSVTAASLASR